MKKTLAIILILSMCLFAFVGCGGSGSQGGGDEEVVQSETPIVVGYSNFSSKFSPFFAETAYDQDVATMTSVALLNTDRQGAVVEKGKTGETRPYNNTDYNYYGPAELTITENEDGTVDYDFDLRDDMTFSDGEPLTADDVIFSMYVLSDPTYDGSSTFFALPIKGMEEYRAGMESLMSLLYKAGRDNKDFSLWDEATQTTFWENLDKAGEAFAQEIVDYCVDNGYAEDVAGAAAAWGFETKADATALDYFYVMADAYGGDLSSLSSTETAGSSLADLGFDPAEYAVGVKTGESAPSIEGIQKTGDYGVKVTLTEVSAGNVSSIGDTGKLNMKNVIASEGFELERKTGDIRFEDCDAGEIRVRTSTGDVTGTLRTPKIFLTKTSTGKIVVPDSTTGGRCEITTTTGDIQLEFCKN